MGRSKGSHRTKGNTRPSSSGHSAELLNCSGKPLSEFVGFKLSTKDNVSDIYAAGHAATDEIDSSLNSGFRLLMKKMLKRDAVTKLKAISEFSDFCSKEEKEVLKSVLPFWPRLFNKLALDCDRRVREAIHKANRTLLLKVKRDFAPYLKSIMGVWLVGQCDFYAPSASAAQHAFASAFPLQKQQEALLFCKDDVFTFFQDNLYNNSTDSVGQLGCSNMSEADGPLDVIVTCTLRSLKLFLSIISQKEHIKVIEEYVTTIVSNKKFWEYVQSKDSQVRVAWYSVANTLCHVMPGAFRNSTPKLVLTALSCLSEEDPAVAPAVWECALSTMSSFKDYTMFINVRKVVLPQLWTFLKNGGKGNATAIFPCLLPLISKLPKDITEGESWFYKKLFNSMRNSLCLERMKSSSSECNAVIKAFFECLHYAVSSEPLITQDINFLQQIIITELVPLVESSFVTIGFHLPVTCLYPLLGHFLHSLEEKAHTKNKELYSENLTLFWDNIFPLCMKIINEGHSQKQNSDLSCLAYFFHCLHKPCDTLIKKKKYVRFDSECTNSDDYDLHDPSSSCIVNSDFNTHLLLEESILFQRTVEFCKYLCLRYEESLEPSHMKLFSEIISAACSIDLFSHLLVVLEISHKEKEDAPGIFYQAVILKWLKEVSSVSTLEIIVDVIFYVCSCVDKDSTLGIFNDICKVEYERLFVRLAVRALSDYKNNPIICEWLGSSIFSHALINHIRNVIVLLNSSANNEKILISESYSKSLYSCLAGTENGETFVGEECIEAILALFSNSFPDPIMWVKCERIDEYNIIDFVCEICEHVFDSTHQYWNYSAFDCLMFELFHFTLSFSENEALDKLVAKATSVWKKSLFCIAKKRKNGFTNESFIHQASNQLHVLLLSLKNFQHTGNLLEHTLMYLTLVQEAFSAECLASSYTPGHIISSVLESILPTEEEWEIMKNGLNLAILPFVLWQVMFSPLYAERHILDCSDTIPKYVIVSKVVSDLLTNAISSEKLAMVPKDLFQKTLLQHLPHIIWSLSYTTGNGFSKLENSDYSSICKLQENSLTLMKFLVEENAIKLISSLFELSLSEGITWSIPLRRTVEIVKHLYPNSSQIFFEFTVEADKSESCHKYITAQAFLSSVTQEKKAFILEELTTNILNSRVIFQNESGLFGMLSKVCCCIQDKEIITQSNIQENILKIFSEMVDSQSVYTESEDIYLQYVAHLSTIMHALIENSCDSLCKGLWDMIIHLLISWVKKCKENQNRIANTSSLVIIMHQTFSVISAISSKMSNHNEEDGADICSVSKSKWNQVFQDQISSDFLILFLQISESAATFDKPSKPIEILLKTVCQTTNYLTAQQILAYFIPSFTKKAGDPLQQEEYVYKMFEVLTPFLTSSFRSLQFSAHLIIIRAMPCIPSLLTTKSEMDDNEDMGENIVKKCFPLIKMLQYTSNIVDTMLLGFKADDCCIVQPYTDSYTYTMAYLLAWNEVMELFTALSSEDRSGFACYLEDSKLLSALLHNLIRLMPENILPLVKNKESITAENTFSSVFLEFPELKASISPSSEELQHLSCNVYFNTLKKAPALVRTWWNNLDKRTAEVIERFTSKNISGLLSQQEIQAVQDTNIAFENMTVKARPLSREVLATYTFDSSTIALSIQLPVNYPLGPISTDSRGKISVGQAQWRNWLLQLTTFLNYQNGAVVDALSLWKKNLDKKFEGIDECMICFYIIHSSSYKLPHLSCSTCRKKFHSSCLFKWFSTSNNSTCPLCRNYF